MKFDPLTALGYVVSTAVALLLLLSLVSGVVAPIVLRCMVIASAAVAFVLFVTTLLDHEVHRAVARVNREVQGDQTSTFRWIRLSDDDWGIFGARWGSLRLAVLRLVLGFEFFVAAVFVGVASDKFVAAGSGFAIAMLLTIRQLIGTNPSQ